MYLLSELLRENNHIHTHYSQCAWQQMTVPQIVSRAMKVGLRKIILVDHDHDNVDNFLAQQEKLAHEVESCRLSNNLEITVGAEVSAFGVGKYLLSTEELKKIKFRLFATNHYSLSFWEHPKSSSPRAYAEHLLENTSEVIRSGLAHCIAHPFVANYLKEKFSDYTKVTQAIKDSELADIFELSKKYDVNWELNYRTIFADPSFIRRFWQIGTEVGVKFLFGTDAHSLEEIKEPRMIELQVETILREKVAG
jgi:histidinol phosphatase-like PHP family hydrolase